MTIEIVIEDIEAALNYIKDEHHWTTHTMCEDVGYVSECKNSFCAIGGITASLFIRQGKVVGYDDENLHNLGPSYDKVSVQLNTIWKEWYDKTNKLNVYYIENENIWDNIEDTNDNNSHENAIRYLTEFMNWCKENNKLKSLTLVHPGNRNAPDLLALTKAFVAGK